jgi:hypothetical protein
VAGDRDVPDAVALEHARLDQRERVLVGAVRDGRVAADREHVLGRVDLAQRRQELRQHRLGLDPPGGNVRDRDEAEPLDRRRGADPHGQVLVLEEGDVDSRARRYDARRGLQPGDVLAGHLHREVVEHSFHVTPISRKFVSPCALMLGRHVRKLNP